MNKKVPKKPYNLEIDALGRFKLGIVAALLLGGSAQAQTACMEATGSINVTADNGVMLWAGNPKFEFTSKYKPNYEVNEMPETLNNALTLQNQLSGTFKICPTGSLDRFGNQVVNILNVTHLSIISRPN